MVVDSVRAGYEYATLGRAGGTPAIFGYDDDRFGSDFNEFKLLEGRLADPARADEAVVSFQVAEDNELQVGDSIDALPRELIEVAEANDLERLTAAFEHGEPPLPADEARRQATELLVGIQQILDELPGGTVRVVGIVAAPGEVPPQYGGVVLLCPSHAGDDRAPAA